MADSPSKKRRTTSGAAATAAVTVPRGVQRRTRSSKADAVPEPPSRPPRARSAAAAPPEQANQSTENKKLTSTARPTRATRATAHLASHKDAEPAQRSTRQQPKQQTPEIVDEDDEDQLSLHLSLGKTSDGANSSGEDADASSDDNTSHPARQPRPPTTSRATSSKPSSKRSKPQHKFNPPPAPPAPLPTPAPPAPPPISFTGYATLPAPQQASTLLRRRLSSSSSPEALHMPLRPSLQRHHHELTSLLTNTVQQGTNMSMLIIGEPGVGKTLLVEKVMGSLHHMFNTDPTNPTLGIVRLNGYVHGDDRTAFQEIARQLCGQFRCTFSKAASFDENLSFLREMLHMVRRAFKSVVFVLEEMEQYTRRSKQVVLYNLLDALQSGEVQAAFIGLTSQQDIRDTLEKRVKSRLSHRKMVLLAPTQLAPPAAAAGPAAAEQQQEEDDSVLSLLQQMLQLAPGSVSDPSWEQQYNSAVQQLLRDASLQGLLKVRQCYGLLPRDLARCCLAAVMSWEAQALADARALPAAKHLLDALRAIAQAEDSQAGAIAQLSVLELAMLLALHKLDERGTDVANFEMAYDEWCRARQDRQAHLWRKGACYRAFEALMHCGVVRFVSDRAEARGLLTRYSGAELLVTKDDIVRGLQAHDSCPDFVRRWFKDESVHTTLAMGF